MKWAAGFSDAQQSEAVEMLNLDGVVERCGVAALANNGIPEVSRPNRHIYEGELFDSCATGSREYLGAFGFASGSSATHQHMIFKCIDSEGMTCHVPALVFMRAFFKPSHLMFPAVFSPGNIDVLSFVDYSTTPPVVVIDDHQFTVVIKDKKYGASQHKPLEWLQTSLSARRAAQSVHEHAEAGWIGMNLPKGRMRIIFHGRTAGKQIYVTRAVLISVDVDADDNIKEVAESVIFHAMADNARSPAASIHELNVVLRRDGSCLLTDCEWADVEPMLLGKKLPSCLHSRRDLIDAVLTKLTTGAPWTAVPRSTFSTTDMTSSFRRWATSGRLRKVLDFLAIARA